MLNKFKMGPAAMKIWKEI